MDPTRLKTDSLYQRVALVEAIYFTIFRRQCHVNRDRTYQGP